MKLGLQIFSWIAVILAALALLNGLSQLATTPDTAYTTLLGGALFGVEGILALMYVHSVDKLDAAR